jgi:hypothetical protein
MIDACEDLICQTIANLLVYDVGHEQIESAENGWNNET